MAKIEYIGNYLEIYEKNDELKKKQESNTPDFWEWEMKILEQEKESYEKKIQEYEDLISGGINPGEELKDFDYAEHLADKSKVVPMTPENIKKSRGESVSLFNYSYYKSTTTFPYIT